MVTADPLRNLKVLVTYKSRWEQDCKNGQSAVEKILDGKSRLNPPEIDRMENEESTNRSKLNYLEEMKPAILISSC
jgi:hypothetical protein